MKAARGGKLLSGAVLVEVVVLLAGMGVVWSQEGSGAAIPSLGIGEALGLGFGSDAGTTRDGEGNGAPSWGLPPWLTFAGYTDTSYRSTNFFEPDYDTTIFVGDSRLEFWIPPWDKGLAWGPYVRLAGIASTKEAAWENAWLAYPGYGLQAYPFSHRWVYETSSLLTNILGPMRLFGEWNRLDYVGEENRWRPDEQIRAGADYWRAINVNDTNEALWAEIWWGLFWQSANEFDDDYDSVIFATAVQAGIRVPNAGLLSWLTPYVVLESSLTDNAEYYWENKLLTGFGVGLAPGIPKETRHGENNWLTQLVVYAEYLKVADYYRTEAPSVVPDYDFRVGISLAVGDWYRRNY
jgi:hypothetical protein